MHPDFLVLDFDPQDIAFSKVVDAVLTARDILVKIKCEGFAKHLVQEECIFIYLLREIYL